MKWSEFREKALKYPWIPDQVDLQGLRVNPETFSIEKRIAPLREFVRHKLSYIAFRPWRKLNLEQDISEWRTSQTLEHAVRCDPHFRGNTDAWYKVEWEILSHVEGGEILASPVNEEEHPNLLSQIQEFEQMDKANGHKGTIFDFVVKRVTEGTRLRGLKSMTIEVFPFPMWFTATPQPREKYVDKRTDYEKRRDEAYANHTEMPPIMPDLSFLNTTPSRH